jgi:hypothetical protein
MSARNAPRGIAATRSVAGRKHGRAALTTVAVLVVALGAVVGPRPGSAFAGPIPVAGPGASETGITGVAPEDVQLGTPVDGVDRWATASIYELAPQAPPNRGRSNQCVTVTGSQLLVNGSRAYVSECRGQGYQIWRMEPTNVTGLYRIRSLQERTMCLDADNRDGLPLGAAIQIWQCIAGGGQTNQYWWVVALAAFGPVELVSNFNGRCFDIDNRRLLANGSVAQQWNCLGRGQYNQWFTPIRFSTGQPGPL